jgi:hypothetical protein
VGTSDAAGVDLVAKRVGDASVPAALTLILHPRPEIEAALLAIEDERLKLVLVHRYGLDGGGKSKTLQEVA